MIRRRQHRNKKYILVIAVVVFALFIAAICILLLCDKDAAKVNSNENIAAIASNQELSLDERVDCIVNNMSDSEKVGQMLMIGIQGTRVDDDTSYMLNEYAIGGVILFDRNMQSQEQVLNLNKKLQESRHGELPLFIAVDEEGGKVARMKDSFEPPPSQREIADSKDFQQAEKWAEYTANGLKNMGFNVNFAPVADVGNDEAGRMYSADPEMVSNFVKAAVQGYEKKNILCTIKHFPGLGKGEADTHDNFVQVNADMDRLQAQDLLPFREMFQQGNQDNFWVMVTHVTYSALDAKNPASMSSVVMTNLLRNQLGYNGIVITDDVDMGAIAKHYSFKDVGVKAVQAGADIVLVCHEYDHEIEVYNGILSAVRDGSISKDRIDSSVKRIVRAKLMHLQPA